MTVFFGERWDAPIVDDAVQVKTPVGQFCYACGEAIAADDRGFIRNAMRLGEDDKLYGSSEPVHAECDLRGIAGHEVGVCHCTGYDDSRATAQLVWQRVGELRGRPLEDRGRR